MRTRDDDVIIEPVDESLVSEEERRGFESARPHVIYKKRHSSAHVQANQGGGGNKEEKLQYCGKGRRRELISCFICEYFWDKVVTKGNKPAGYFKSSLKVKGCYSTWCLAA